MGQLNKLTTKDLQEGQYIIRSRKGNEFILTCQTLESKSLPRVVYINVPKLTIVQCEGGKELKLAYEEGREMQKVSTHIEVQDIERLNQEKCA